MKKLIPFVTVVALAATALPAYAQSEDPAFDAARHAQEQGDDWSAVKALEHLAAKGDVRAMTMMAAMLRDGGNGLAPNPVRAMQLFRRAAEAGHVEAQRMLAESYVKGIGVSRSVYQAYVWLSVAASNAKAADRAEILKERAPLTPQLTENEAAQAEATATMISGKPLPSSVAAAPEKAPEQAAPPPRVRIESDKAAPIRLAPAQAKRVDNAQEQTPAPRRKRARNMGSGIILTGDGKILTNAHVVPYCRTITVTFPDGSTQAGSVRASDKKNDLAVVETPSQGLETAHFRDGKPIRSGDGVVVVGFPLSSMLSREANVTVGVVSAMNGRGGDKRFLQITAPVQKGNSGGPLADMSGNVIGIVATKLDAMKVAERTGDLPQNVNFAIKTDVAEKFLAENGITPDSAPPGTEYSAADVADRIKRVTVLIECEK